MKDIQKKLLLLLLKIYLLSLTIRMPSLIIRFIIIRIMKSTW